MRHDDVGEILVQPDDLSRRVRELGAQISADYEGRRLLRRSENERGGCHEDGQDVAARHAV